MLLLGLSIGLSWYIYIHFKDPEYLSIMAARETSNWTSYEVKPFYYYWNFFIQSGLWTIPSLTALIYPYLKNRVENIKAYRFAILWTIISVIFLSCVPEKKVRYLVPALIPLALTTGFYIEYLMQDFSKIIDKKEKIWTFFSFGFIALIGFLYPFVVVFLLKESIKGYIPLFIFSSLFMYLFSFSIIKGLIDRNFRRIFYSMISIFVLIVITLVPVRGKIFHNPDFAPAREAQIIEEQFNIKTYRLSDIAPEIVWNFGKSIPLLQNNEDHLSLPSQNTFGIIADKSDSAILKNRFINYKIEKKYIINMNYGIKNKVRYLKDYYILTKNEE